MLKLPRTHQQIDITAQRCQVCNIKPPSSADWVRIRVCHGSGANDEETVADSKSKALEVDNASEINSALRYDVHMQTEQLWTYRFHKPWTQHSSESDTSLTTLFHLVLSCSHQL